MPIDLSLPAFFRLREQKLYYLEQLAYLDVADVLPTPPPDYLERKTEILQHLEDVEGRFDKLGADANSRDVRWLAEGFWEAQDEDEAREEEQLSRLRKQFES